MGNDLGCGDVIVTPQRPSYVLTVTFSTGVLSELKMVKPVFVKIADQ